jgi:hypothetical protein
MLLWEEIIWNERFENGRSASRHPDAEMNRLALAWQPEHEKLRPKS